MSILNLLGIEPKTEEITKACGHCGVVKPLSQFPKHRAHHDSRCFICKKIHAQEIKALKKDPLTPSKPNKCDCCGRPDVGGKMLGLRKQVGLCLDHSYDENGKPYFRGWLCIQCNSGIGYLGDTLEAVKRAITYLEKGVKNA